LLLLALKRGEIPAINSLVQAYNLVFLRCRCCMGAHDLDAIILPVSLRLLTGRETFTPLVESVPVAVGALCTKLSSCNWSAWRRSAILSLLINSRRAVSSLGTLYLFFSGRRSHAP
jgi:DNA/RNA-binding domain of Phe-tRNA-synthetase-like protein